MHDSRLQMPTHLIERASHALPWLPMPIACPISNPKERRQCDE